MRFKNIHFLLLAGLVMVQINCSKGGEPVPPVVIPPIILTNDVDCWLTKADLSVLLQKQNSVISFTTTANSNPDIEVDSTQHFQSIDGFGYTLTGGSAYVINQMAAADKANLLQELFGTGANSIAVSYLRISIGASDLNATAFTYDDIPAGQTDINLANFSLDPDRTDLVPLLKAIIAINPGIKILATPWSPPVWMKDNNSFVGGSLNPVYYAVFAQYFVKYIQQMQAEGITIDAITPQNEPLNPNNEPSLLMLATQQADFIKNNLGPAFQAAGINTKIIIYDHNCDHVDYPLSILNDAQAKPFVDGAAFHLYAGDINALSAVHNTHPDKKIYFTEQFTASTGNFAGDLKWHLKNVIIGSMRNWSSTALEWNLANDPSYGPHTPGGCNTCKGALTIGTGVTRNVAYYIIAHASKFVPPGSVRIASNIQGNLQSVAFQTPGGKKVLIVENDGTVTATFNIKLKGKLAATQLAAGSVATYTW
ncbi:MAG: glycoside hydrolase family 30 beta sandwich domain-containing protein [Ferruginibacter sp.]